MGRVKFRFKSKSAIDLMGKKLILLTFSLLLAGCALFGPRNQKTVNLSSGTTAEVFFEKQLSPEKEEVLVVDYKTDLKVISEKTVERDVREIWDAVEVEADRLSIVEAVIRYRLLEGEEYENGQTVKKYTGLLFAAEKIENGTWKIDKIY